MVPPELEPTFLTSVVDAVADPVFVKDAKHRWIVLNEAFCRFMGLAREDLLGKSDFDFFPEEQAKVFWEKDELVLASGEENVNVEQFTGADQKTRTISTKKTRLIGPDGQPFLVGVIRDITEFKQIEVELRVAKDAAEAANRAKSLFLANVSHELRTPLNALLGLTEVLLHSEPTPDQREHLLAMHRSGEIQAGLIEDLLILTSAEASQLEPQRRSFDLRTWAERAVRLLRPRAEAKGLSLTVQVAEELPTYLLSDPDRLRQIVLNLLDNAIKFTSDGSVALALRPEGESTLLLSVSDTGSGVAPADQERLFLPFVQGNPSATRSAGGTGLGLAISRRLAGLLGGRLELQSTAGEGATFRLLLPLVAGSAPAPTEEASPLSVSGAETLRILVVEDNRINQRVLKAMLARFGSSARMLDTGAAALEALASSTYDLVFLDLRLPDLDGREIARQIRASLPSERRPRVVALTAHSGAEDRAACLAAGMDAFLSKPVELLDIQQALQEALQSRTDREPAP